MTPWSIGFTLYLFIGIFFGAIFFATIIEQKDSTISDIVLFTLGATLLWPMVITLGIFLEKDKP